MKRLTRRDFIKRGAQFGASVTLGSRLFPHAGNRSSSSSGDALDIAVVQGEGYLESTRKAVEMLGGMEKFVPKGSRVVILPNSQSRHPGTFTKPEIVRSVIRMCKEAGAGEVNCLSWLGTKNWDSTGLGEAVKAEGANLKLIERKDENFKAVPLPKGKVLKEAQIMKEFYNNDVFIDIPITKDHAGNKFTGTMKNYMGLNSPTSNRFFHTGTREAPDDIEHLDQCIADLNLVFAPALCVVDATEFITTNGPFGPGELTNPNKVVAGTDRIAIDAYCCTLWGLKGKDIIMIKQGYEHGMGEIDLEKVKIKMASV